MAESWHKRYRFELIWSLVATTVAIALAFVPLLDILGYEFSTVFCLVTTVSAASICLRRLGDGSFAVGARPIGSLFVALFVRAWAPLLGPLLVILLNALRVPNCDIPVGLALFGLLPTMTVAVVVAVVLVVSVLVPSARRKTRILLYVSVTLASIASGAAHLLTEPPIFAFHPTIGYFAGSVYDEAMSIPPGLLGFRLMSLSFVAFVLAGLELGVRRRRKEPLLATALVAVMAAGLWAGVYSNRFDLRIESHREDIAEALGGRYETDHFIIHYSLDSRELSENIASVAADHEFRYHQLTEFFGVEPELPLRSFIYADHRQKLRYMGAGRTLIAKPWLGEMHITYDGLGDGILTHEMAHLFSAAFGGGPLRLAGGVASMDMGLVEGAAEAAAWDGLDLTFHGWAAALYRIELAPDLSEIVGAAGFWAHYGRMVYTLMGSFSRHLIDTRGVALYREVYRSGDFEAVYETPIADLIVEWRTYLDGLTLSDELLEVASFRYDRPPIFGKRCARALANEANRGRLLAGAGQYEAAAECLASVVADDPENFRYRYEWARYAMAAGLTDQAETLAREVEQGPSGRTLQARASELRGDIAWTRGDIDTAVTHYRRVIEAPLLSSDLRRVAIKLAAVESSSIRDPIYRLFIERPAPHRDSLTVDLAEMQRITGSPILAYLLGLRMYEARDFHRTVDYLSTTLAAFERIPGESAGPTLDASSRGWTQIRHRTMLRMGQAYFQLGDFASARRSFSQLAHDADPEVLSIGAEALNWLRRCDWQEGLRSTGP